MEKMKKPSFPKSVYPKLLARTLKKLQVSSINNIKSGLGKADIASLDKNQVISRFLKNQIRVSMKLLMEQISHFSKFWQNKI